MLRKTTAWTAAAALAVFSFAGSAAAQERKADVDVKAGQGKVQVDVNAQRGQARNGAERKAAGMTHRASEIQGMTVKNGQNKDLGSVSDIVIDVRQGKVKYAALSYGGVLGLGDKLFAVPWTALEHRHDAAAEDACLVLNIDEALLKKSPGFDQNNWPNFADPKFSEEIDKFYLDIKGRRGAGVGVEVGGGKVNVDVDAARQPADVQKPSSSRDIVHPSAKLIGMTVKNPSGKELGSVNDLVIDMDSGDVRYAALSFGGVLGVGDKLFAIPWHAFDCQYDADSEDYFLTLAASEATLKNASGFDQSNWPNFADPKFTGEIDKQFPRAKTGAEKAQPRERNN